jgi:hypothetical protein
LAVKFRITIKKLTGIIQKLLVPGFKAKHSKTTLSLDLGGRSGPAIQMSTLSRWGDLSWRLGKHDCLDCSARCAMLISA